MNIKMKLLPTCIIIFTSVVLIGCSFFENKNQDIIISPPTLTGFEELPVAAKIKCTGDDTVDSKTIVYINQFPGLEPSDDSSNYGIRGDVLGELSACTDISIISYQWSSADEEYYLEIVENDSELKGWVVLRLITIGD